MTYKITDHAETYSRPRSGPDWKSQIKDEIHATTGVRSGCPGSNRAVIRDWTGPTGP